MHYKLLVLAAWLAAQNVAIAEDSSAPPLISYQGTLTDADASTKKLSINLYDAPEALTPIWGPQVFDNVPILNGRFAVILGTTDSTGRALAGIIGGNPRYVGISVDGRELQPRQPLIASTTISAADNNPTTLPEVKVTPPVEVPPGTIVAYWSSKLPEGWLLCDGGLVPEGPKYDKLRAAIGGNLPDFRGLFLRGIGQNSNPAFRYEGDATRTLFQFQQDEFKSHVHKFDDYTFSENAGFGGKAWGSSGKTDLDNVPGSPFAHNTAATGGEETRPKNAAVYWIIKY